MNRILWLFMAGLLAITIAGLMLSPTHAKEPSYGGRSLSFWLKEWAKSYNDPTNPATIAIRAIGSDGLPILLALVSKDESPEKREFWHVAGKVIPSEYNPINLDATRAITAAKAINLLGVQAKPAFPTLTNLFSTRAYCLPAGIGLAGIGHDGVVFLLQSLTNQDWGHRYSAAFALEEARSDINIVVPALLEVVMSGGQSDEDNLLRGAAASALVQLHAELNRVVPVFSGFLTNQDARLRVWGASLLGGFGGDAKAAVPLLLKARMDVNPDVREAAERTLKEIDSEAAVEAGLK